MPMSASFPEGCLLTRAPSFRAVRSQVSDGRKVSPCSEILSIASLTTSTPYPSICNEAFVGLLLAQGTHYPVNSVGPVFCLFWSWL